MHKLRRYIVAASLIVSVSCSNFSNLCRHGNAEQSFRYQFAEEEPLSAEESGASFHSDRSITQAIPITWNHLKDVSFEVRFNKELQMDMNYPVFGNMIKQYKGKVLSITGYLIPLNPEEGLYAISAYNFASCFFCGRAGAESVVSLKFKKKPRNYKTDEYLTMKGKFELNDTNYRDFIYIFRDTEEVKP